MKRKPFLPDDDAGVLAVLIAVDTNLPGALATKYDITAPQLLRLRHGRYSYEWFMSANSIARQWAKSLTDAHASRACHAHYLKRFASMRPTKASQ